MTAEPSGLRIPGRLLVTGGISLLLHAALLISLGTLPYHRALTGIIEEIEVSFVNFPKPASRAQLLSVPSSQARLAPVLPAKAAPAEAHDEHALVEARHDVATLHNPRPPYPLAARRQGIEGKVVLRALVLANGHCHEVQLARSSGSTLLDEAARSTVQRWRFVPATRGGEPVRSWVDVPVKFQLRDASRS